MARRRSKLLHERRLRRVLVTTKTGESFAGLLHALDGHAWVLRDVQALGVGEAAGNIGVDGELIVLVADVAFAQFP